LLGSPEYKRDGELKSIAAHYCCEIASEDIDQKQWSQAREQLKKAFTFDRKHVRAALLLAGLEHALGNRAEALKELLRVRRQHPEFSSHVIQLLMQWHADEDDLDTLTDGLQGELAEDADPALIVALANLTAMQSGTREAIAFLDRFAGSSANLELLIKRLQFHRDLSEGESRQELTSLQDLLELMQKDRPAYQCNHCGYQSRQLYWLCPSCQNWDKTKPLALEVAGSASINRFDQAGTGS